MSVCTSVIIYTQDPGGGPGCPWNENEPSGWHKDVSTGRAKIQTASQRQFQVRVWSDKSAAQLCIVWSSDSLLLVSISCCSTNISLSFSSNTGSLDSAATYRTYIKMHILYIYPLNIPVRRKRNTTKDSHPHWFCLCRTRQQLKQLPNPSNSKLSDFHNILSAQI